MPKWQSGHIPISGRRSNRHPLEPSNQTNRRITVFFKGYAYNEMSLSPNGETLCPEITYRDTLFQECPQWTQYSFPLKGYREML